MINTIKKFFEIYQAGAFINTPTEALRAIRSLDGFRKITSKEIKIITGDIRFLEPKDTLDLLLQLVVVVLEDMRFKHENMIKLSTFLREILGPISWYFTNLESNDSAKGTKKFKVYVSMGVISALEQGEKPEVVYEHKIPIKVIRNEMIQKCFDSESVLKYLKYNLKAVFITKFEDQNLSKLGFKDSMPENLDRYTAANIELYDKPVFFRRGHSTMKYIK